jgi:hypothetical protein
LGTFPETCFISPHPPSTLHLPHCPGDIEVFKDMALKELNLRLCEKLTGEWGRKGGG